ncbi:hypothetical protein ACIGNX_33175 [Actinosynnema sp. NPDC053489]
MKQGNHPDHPVVFRDPSTGGAFPHHPFRPGAHRVTGTAGRRRGGRNR